MELLLYRSESEERDPEEKLDGAYRLAGTGPTPRLLRTLSYPIVTTPRTPAIDSTLTNPPLLRPPLSALQNPVLLATLTSRPDLFRVSTPLHISHLATFLEPHPNRPLVESVLLGLREGFWPGHDGNFDSIAHLADPPTRLEENDLVFLADSALKDFEKGYLSPAFDTLLPGMHISPSFVVRPEHSRARQVCDQTISGLNDGISRAQARTQYDALAELGALMRYRRRRGEDKHFHMLWKSDVAGGFRNLPVHPLWQLKQIHRIRLLDSKKRSTVVYFVDQRLILGGRMSPRIFCDVMNLINWATRYHFYLEFPLAFVDDDMGFDVSGGRAFVEHPETGERRLVCAEQAKLLQMWTFLGWPWDWAKQLESDSSLVMLGILVHAVDFTVTLTPMAIDDFVTFVHEFLAFKQKRPPLFLWWRLLGYLNWICNVLPFIKFALQVLYAKIEGKSQRNAGVKINVEVERALLWIVEEVSSATPLSFLDPALEQWGRGDADVVLYSDACLVANRLSPCDEPQSGLGFWARVKGVKYSFWHRFPPSWDIRYAEALAIFSAIIWAADTFAPRRILLFTDSALNVYAFDSGKVHDDMLDLVGTTYRYLANRKIDLRVRPIRGEENKHADFLSRTHPSFFRPRPLEVIAEFTPLTHLLGGLFQ